MYRTQRLPSTRPLKFAAGVKVFAAVPPEFGNCSKPPIRLNRLRQLPRRSGPVIRHCRELVVPLVLGVEEEQPRTGCRLDAIDDLEEPRVSVLLGHCAFCFRS